MLDQRARELLGMSGEQFMRMWDAGEFKDPGTFAVVELALMIPLTGRSIRAHLRTGPVSLEDISHLATTETGVEPLRADWPAILGATRAGRDELT